MLTGAHRWHSRRQRHVRLAEARQQRPEHQDDARMVLTSSYGAKHSRVVVGSISICILLVDGHRHAHAA
jgi:hypothetical protein